jgi:Rrf2 family protein
MQTGPDAVILISRKVDYGILALHHLMCSPNGASARELADQYGLSRAFVANILKQLCQSGFVASHRGVNGGYRLAVEPKDVPLVSVIAALDGPFQLMQCANSDDDGACELVKICPVKSPLRVVHERLLNTLKDVTLEDLRVSGDGGFVDLPMEMRPNGCAADLPG